MATMLGTDLLEALDDQETDHLMDYTPSKKPAFRPFVPCQNSTNFSQLINDQ